MARKLHWFGLAVLGLSLTGCVTQEKYNAVKLANDDLTSRLGAAQGDADNARAQADAYKQQLDRLNQNGGTEAALNENLSKQNADLTAQVADLNKRLEDALNRPVTAGSMLPAPLTSALTEFAAANSDLVDFDAARGTVKFKSDVLFASGSAELTPKAKEAITRFASILNSSAANGYELMVCGHTDNAPVVNPETIRRGNLNNWYLSSHRAIAVGTELIGAKVSAQRIAVVGYADERPVASNASESGKSQNRRVEVLILPTTVRSGPAVASTSGGRAERRARAADMNKDSTASGDSEETPAIQHNK